MHDSMNVNKYTFVRAMVGYEDFSLIAVKRKEMLIIKWLLLVAYVCGHSIAAIAGSNSAESMNICLLCFLCVVPGY